MHFSRYYLCSFLAICISFFFWSTLFAQTPVVIDASADAELQMFLDELSIKDGGWAPSCSFTKEQQELLILVNNMFTDHADTKIAKRLFETPSYQELISNYSNDFLSTIQATLAQCNGERMPMSTYNDLADFRSWLLEYIWTIQTLRQVESQVDETDEVFGAMENLRDHIFWDILAFNLPDSWYLQQTVEMEVVFKMNGQDENIDVSFVMWGEGVTDIETMEMASSYDAWLDLDLDDWYTDMTVWWTVNMEIRLVDGHLYAKMSDLKIDMWDTTFDSEWEREEFDTTMNMLKLFQWKFIDIPLLPEWMMAGMQNGQIRPDPMMMISPQMIFGDLKQQQQMMIDMIEQDWMMTYAKAWNTNYLWLNPAACGTMNVMWPWMVTECLWLRSDMLDATDGKWMMFMAMEWNNSSMWLTDRFMNEDDKMPEDLAYLRDKPIISRNEQKILEIDLPFPDDMWWLKYENENVMLRAKFPDMKYDYETWQMSESSIDLMMSGIRKPQQKFLRGTVTGEDITAKMALDIEWDSSDMKVWVSFEMERNDENDMPAISFMMSLDQQQEFVDAAVIEAPYEWDVIDINSLMDLTTWL